MLETGVLFLGWEDPLEKEMAPHSSFLAWKIPWTEEPGGLQSMRLQRVGHDWAHTHYCAVYSIWYISVNAPCDLEKKCVFCSCFGYQFSSVTQSCSTLCDPMDCSPPGSSVHGIFQARELEWGAISFSRGSSRPRDGTPGLPHYRQMLYHLSHHPVLGLI